MSGKPQVLLMLQRLTAHIREHDGVRFVTLGVIADGFRDRQPPPSQR